ncbi:MAG: helix-turn-helix transcriptional regulator [Bacteroidales bacterium]|nr:helix-turn-helix transcriptional regulator [Bacteroidales bacterium]MCF8350428.1 helix-turn-helix transcriptional regulator [Bacteroidales bacterium]MCF8377679.1 helix-turn-helix transcriptional regulator [Bacteroidales bacterium]MCF8401955.1 helix-turn-helix transcriptional regulator [Bacteroidales bacterium]
MVKRKSATTEKLILKNMLCHCCKRLIELELNAIDVQVKCMHLGEIDITYEARKTKRDDILEKLKAAGFIVVNNKEEQLLEQVKAAITDLVHHTTYNAMVRNSDYLVERFAVSYQYISSLFPKYENTTLEKYIILHKIEKVKELLQQDELTLSEIAYMMGYSSVQYLSTQFKYVTGVSVSEFKNDPGRYRQPLDKLGA